MKISLSMQSGQISNFYPCTLPLLAMTYVNEVRFDFDQKINTIFD